MIITKIRGMQGKLLTLQDYKSLSAADTQESFFHMVARYPSYSYFKIIQNDRISMQNQLYISLVNDTNKISLASPRLPNIHLPNLHLYKLKAQIQMIKIRYTDFLGNNEDFIQDLQGTIFYDILKPVKFGEYPFYLDLYFIEKQKKYMKKNKKVPASVFMLDKYMEKKFQEIKQLIYISEEIEYGRKAEKRNFSISYR